MIAIGNYCMSAEIAHVPKKNSEGTRKKRWMMKLSERYIFEGNRCLVCDRFLPHDGHNAGCLVPVIAQLDVLNIQLEAELAMYERDETFGTLAIQLTKLEEELEVTKTAGEAFASALEKECKENEVLRNTVSLLKNENERLTKRIEELEEELADEEMRSEVYDKNFRKAYEENKVLKRALNEYGQHLPHCNLSPHSAFGTHWQPVCNCGLDALLTGESNESE